MQSPQPFDKDSLMSMLTAAKEKAAAERMLPALPAEYTSPMQMMVQSFMQRKGWEGRVAKNEFQIRQTFLGQEAYYSSTPLDRLKPILLKDMKVRQRHKVIQQFDEIASALIGLQERYLLCRIIAPPNRIVCVGLGVEDPAGWAQLVSLYNYPGTYSAGPLELDTLFPLNSVIAIREPCLKMALAAVSHSHIRVDSPTDIVLLEPGSPLLKNVRWTTGERPLPVHTKTENEWKDVGDKHFKVGEFYGAIAGYSLALQRSPSLISVRLNRSLANLRVGRNIQAVEDARFVLTDEQLPSADRVKALYRCAQAMYAEGKYAAAKKWYSKCISIDPTLADALDGIQRSDSRIKEQASGLYDWRALFEQQMKSPSKQVDMAEFQGPIEKRLMSNRGGGRGIVASRTIMPGELLVVSKPFVSADSTVDSEGGAFIALDFLTNAIQDESQFVMIQRAISRAASNPSDAEAILDLYDGAKDASPTVTRPSGSTPNPEHDIDSSKIEAICLLNSFGGTQKRESPTLNGRTATLLYIVPSYFNHSCLPNAHRESMGDIMVIRAMREIKEGDEITLTYAHGLGYEERTEMLKKWFPRCDCSLCEHERVNGASNRQERQRLLKRLKVPSLTVPQLRDIVKKMDSTYSSGYGWLRSESAVAHQALAQALEELVMEKMQNNLASPKMIPILLTESIQEGFKALEALGVEVIDKKTNPAPVTQEVDLPISVARLPYESSTCVALCLFSVARFCALGDLNRAEMWMRAALWIEGMWKRDTIDHFALQWSETLKSIGDAAYVILGKISLSRAAAVQ